MPSNVFTLWSALSKTNCINEFAIICVCESMIADVSNNTASSYVAANPNEDKRFTSTLEPHFLFTTAASATCKEEIIDLGQTADIIACVILQQCCWRPGIQTAFLVAENHRFQ